MSFLLDTNIVSEWCRPQPNPDVIAWLTAVNEDDVFLSVVTLAEMRHGVDRLEPGVRQRRLEAWLTEDLPTRFEGRIVPITPEIANAWGQVMARAQGRGRPIAAMDAFIAATALYCGLTLVTRNTKDFEGLDLPHLNP
jgi:toxin FitB